MRWLHRGAWLFSLVTALDFSIATAAEPVLPRGLGGSGPTSAAADDRERSADPATISVAGFWEARAGLRTAEDPLQDSASLGETRLQLRLERAVQRSTLKLTTDLLYDGVQDQEADSFDPVEEGSYLDLREASLAWRFGDQADMKIGRQVLTWGTGDLLFINDLFPKDFVSFFIGRDAAYLKALSDALRLNLFSPQLNLDMVYTPRFDPDRFLNGRRLSFFNPVTGTRAGEDVLVEAAIPDRWLEDDEIALRLYRNAGSWQLAVYGYSGFWKSPAGVEAATGAAGFPALAVYGFSAEGPAGRGVANLEVGYYDSRDDRDGDDPSVRNSEWRLLLGYRRELARDLNLGLQYYLEWMDDHAAYRDSLPAASRVADEHRHVVTTRLTRQALNQNLLLSLFLFYSPSDRDGYLRPLLSYQLDDHWSVQVGANWFFGEDEQTFFAQLEDNSNVYAGVRYGFAVD